MTQAEALRTAIEALEAIKQDPKIIPPSGLIKALKEAEQPAWAGLNKGEHLLFAWKYGDTPLTLVYAVGHTLKERNT
jgi:hypothetical protein